jgi:hypothetical protein
MRRDAEWFEGREPLLIYIARKLREATELERILSAAGIDYGVEPDEYEGGIIFRRRRIGAFFYVLPEAERQAESAMRENGFRARKQEPQPPPEAEHPRIND